ncbi:MAG: hypothetical protein ACYS1C_02795 [Planctomycetota bacterium]|jgi:hypothetical protein
MQLKEYEKNYRLSFENGMSVEVLKRDGAFGGLGQVKFRRRKLRSAELPIMPLIATPDGYEVSRLQFEDVQKAKDSLTLDLAPFVRRRGRMEWVCCDGQDRWNVGPWDGEAEKDRGGLVRMVLSAVTRTIGGVEFVGFSYSYKFRSRKYRIYRIHDRATWELGGYATANSFWMQGPFNEPQKTIRNKDDGFSTSWCRLAEEAVELQQFLPLFTALQGFTFQFDRQNLLVTAFEAPFHCRALYQKNAGQNYFVHWHQLCDDLSGCLEFPALQVLCAEVPDADKTELVNCYCAVREELQGHYADQSGIVREPAVVSGRLEVGEPPSAAALERGLNELARAGCERVYVPGLMRALGRAATARSQEARERAARFLEHAHHRGVQVAVSLTDCCAPWLVAALAPEGQEEPSAAVGPPAVPAQGLRDASGQAALLDHLRRLRSELSVDALFARSSLDGIAEEFDWRWPAEPDDAPAPSTPAIGAPDFDEKAGQIRSFHERSLELVASLQRLGYKCTLSGAGALGAPAGPLDLQLLDGSEFILRDGVLEFPYDSVADSRREPEDVYFRGCANRLAFVLVYEGGGGVSGKLAEWWDTEQTAINNAYHAVREHMERSRHLPQGRGVLWRGADPDVQVLWCYKCFEWAVGEEAEVFDVMASVPIEPEEGRFAPRPFTVYLVQNAREP